MIINGQSLLRAKPFETMEDKKIRFEGTSYGLSEAGYDIRIKQDVTFYKDAFGDRVTVREPDGTEETFFGSFCLASVLRHLICLKIWWELFTINQRGQEGL